VAVEAGTRILVSLTQPEQGPSRGFDRKYYLAKTPPDPKNPNYVVLLGDSFTNTGLYPELLSARLKESGLNLNVRNLASSRSTPAMNLFFLKTAQQSRIQPKLVIYNINLEIFNRFYINHPDATPENSLKKTYIGQCVYNSPQGFEESADCFLQKYSYFFRYRNYLKQQFNRLDRNIFLTEKMLQRSALTEGCTVMETSTEGWSPGYLVYTKSDYAKAFQVSAQNVAQFQQVTGHRFQWDDQAFRQIQAYCIKQHIPFILVWFPYNPVENMYYGTSREKTLKQYEKNFAQLSQAPNTWFIDLHDTDSNPTHYLNTTHLNIVGAIQLTNNLADRILDSQEIHSTLANSLNPNNAQLSLQLSQRHDTP
jgi:hypothetical protein